MTSWFHWATLAEPVKDKIISGKQDEGTKVAYCEKRTLIPWSEMCISLLPLFCWLTFLCWFPHPQKGHPFFPIILFPHGCHQHEVRKLAHEDSWIVHFCWTPFSSLGRPFLQSLLGAQNKEGCHRSRFHVISCVKSFQDVTNAYRLSPKCQELCGLHIHLHVPCIALCSQLSWPHMDTWYVSSISMQGIWGQNCFLSAVIPTVLSTQLSTNLRPNNSLWLVSKVTGYAWTGTAWSWDEEGKYQQPLAFKGHFLHARHCAKGFMCIVSSDPDDFTQGKLTI